MSAAWGVIVDGQTVFASISKSEASDVAKLLKHPPATVSALGYVDAAPVVKDSFTAEEPVQPVGAVDDVQYHSDSPENTGVGEFCQPGPAAGAHQWFKLTFEDQDRGYAIFDNEDEARKAFARAEGLGWNCHLWQLCARAEPAAAAPTPPAAEPVESVNASLLACCVEMDEAWPYFSEYDVPIGLGERIKAAIASAAGLPASPADAVDAARLDWLDQNLRFRMGWKVGQAPAGNVSITSVIFLGEKKPTTIRDAIDAAKAQAGGEHG